MYNLILRIQEHVHKNEFNELPFTGKIICIGFLIVIVFLILIGDFPNGKRRI